MANKDIKLTRKQLNFVAFSYWMKNLCQYKFTLRKSWEYVSTEVFCLHFVLLCFYKGTARQGGGRKRRKGFESMFIVPKRMLFPFSQACFLLTFIIGRNFQCSKSFFLILDLIMLLTGLCMFEHVKLFSC